MAEAMVGVAGGEVETQWTRFKSDMSNVSTVGEMFFCAGKRVDNWMKKHPGFDRGVGFFMSLFGFAEILPFHASRVHQITRLFDGLIVVESIATVS